MICCYFSCLVIAIDFYSVRGWGYALLPSLLKNIKENQKASGSIPFLQISDEVFGYRRGKSAKDRERKKRKVMGVYSEF